uniref:Cytochrome P450 n=1 Tax=Perinereis nuntia TaxID=460893 RepID=U3KV89_PERNU|nr:cytochrome P450 [Perinereis nuntia]
MQLLGLEKISLPSWLSWVDTRSTLVFSVTFLTGMLWTSSQRKKNPPPGPMIWPIIGNLPQVSREMRKHKNQSKMLQEFSKQYGPVISLHLGPQDIVFVTDYDLIKEVPQTNAFEYSNRPSDIFFEEFNHNNGMLFANGKKWEEIRKFTVVALRDFGVGKRSLEFIVQKEAELICEKMVSEKEPFYPKKYMGLAVANVIFNIVFGDRFEYDDPDFMDILAKMDFMARSVGATTIDRFIRILRYIPIDTPWKKVLRNRNQLEKYTYKKIEEHKETFDPNVMRDYIDLYLKITQEGHKYETLTEPHPFQTIFDLYFAGAETTSTSLDWFILYMIIHPDIQKKIQQEIEQVVGDGRKVTLEDRGAMPYTVAALQELQRVVSIAPTTVPHCTVKDTHLNGYFIPEDTMVIPHIASIHLNPKYFPEPLKFEPERWLDGGKLIKSEHFLPFGIGPRKWVGENLAKMELFIFATNFLQHYNFKLADGHPKPTTEGTNTGITMQSQPYYIKVERR